MSTPVLRRTPSYTHDPVSEDEEKKSESSFQVAELERDADIDEHGETDAVHPWRHKGPALVMVLLLSCELVAFFAIVLQMTCYGLTYSGFKFCFGHPRAHEIHSQKRTRHHKRTVRCGMLIDCAIIYTKVNIFKVDQ